MHFQVRVFPKLVSVDQDTAMHRGRPQLGTAIFFLFFSEL
jgi:hypothetical protein